MSCLVHYEVTLPDGRVRVVSFDKSASGYDCIKLLCRSEGVFEEADYFGLTYPGSRGEELWVNSRNRLAKQVPRPGRCQLRLAVRFFVQPHMLVEEATRQLFHLEALRRAGHQHPTEAARTTTLEQVANGAAYGCHFHPVKDCQRRKLLIGVDCDSVLLCRADGGVLLRYAFPRVQKVTRSGRLIYLLLSNQDGIAREFGFRLASGKAAEGLYRCVTETHSFFRSGSVRSRLAMQRRRRHPLRNSPRVGDLKASLAALIKGGAVGSDAVNSEAKSAEDCCPCSCYAFDVRCTAKEVHDAARRRQFRDLRSAGGALKPAVAAAATTAEPAACPAGPDESINALASRLECLLQERTCCLCSDQPISIVLVPCSHMLSCQDCSAKLLECPICRGQIAGKQTVLLP
ncbi:hypothetical protein BOX15_Mlig010769g1 [Macrostomum lignano]|uniref:RING-type domain-containing protein n=1 Tax=Macrostomum lignano TaxID=282301 RepID=A0A267EVI9_9PLAT|nr:hypothetical protein BOX15_Mlig010769g1 [Macrostomum lignano]